ncbi:uncharacterized protein A4U43_C09F14140 [Asparagus officinalis]|uniref:Uncharacterized protein n=1 Tax=Asparagus officinalis TaxID=4686 RepID=A0A5P1E7A3_ASPOF|nr:uncharacterized protein A4U43_C09F14140 [Asparagus officinalis]
MLTSDKFALYKGAKADKKWYLLDDLKELSSLAINLGLHFLTGDQNLINMALVKGLRCDISSIEIGITNTGTKFRYDSVFEVEVKNNCGCTLINVFLNSEGFASTTNVDPDMFRRDRDGYLVNDGKGIASSHSVKFQYAWDRAFKMTPLAFQAAC